VSLPVGVHSKNIMFPVVPVCSVPDRSLGHPIEMLQACSGPMNGRSDRSLAN
jgi:hypothetical protein